MRAIRVFVLFVMVAAFCDLKAQTYDITDTTQLYQSILNDTAFISKVKKKFKQPSIEEMRCVFSLSNKSDSALGLTFLGQLIPPAGSNCYDSCVTVSIRLSRFKSNNYKLSLSITETGSGYKGCASFHSEGVSWTLKRKKGGYAIKKREYKGAYGSYKYL